MKIKTASKFKMKQTVKIFLGEIVNYVSLYRSVSLSLMDAFGTILKHRKSPQFWMLSKFVIGTNRLIELSELLHKIAKKELPVESVKTKIHDFLNVFGSSILSYAQDLPVNGVIKMLKYENRNHYRLTEQYFVPKELAAPELEIKMLRKLSELSRRRSFVEHVEDLQVLGLLT